MDTGARSSIEMITVTAMLLGFNTHLDERSNYSMANISTYVYVGW